MKKIIRLNENDLTKLVNRVILEQKKSKILNEIDSDKTIEFLKKFIGKDSDSKEFDDFDDFDDFDKIENFDEFEDFDEFKDFYNLKDLDDIKNIDQISKSSKKLSSPLKSFKVGSKFGAVRPGLDTVRPHSGVDLYATTSTEIFSPASGKVVKADMGENFGCGGSIWIKHKNGLESRFCHCSKIKVNLGDNVKRGQLVGLTGGGKSDLGRGFSTGPHLHYTLAKDGKLVDPEPYIKLT